MLQWPLKHKNTKYLQLLDGGFAHMESYHRKCLRPDPKVTSKKVTSSSILRPIPCLSGPVMKLPRNNRLHLLLPLRNLQLLRKRPPRPRSQPLRRVDNRLRRLCSTQMTRSSRYGKTRVSMVTYVKWQIHCTILSE